MSLKKLANLAVVVVIAVGLSACAGRALTQQELSQIKYVAVVNEFPQNPGYTTMGLTILNTKDGFIEDDSLRQHVVEALTEHLHKWDYVVKEVQHSDNAAGADMVVKIVPELAINIEQGNTFPVPGENSVGYGVYQRQTLGVNVERISFAAVKLEFLVDGQNRCGGCSAQSITRLPRVLGQRWADLDEVHQQALRHAVKKDVRKAIKQAFESLGG